MGQVRGALMVLVGATCACSASIRYAMQPGPLLVDPGSVTAIDLYLEFADGSASMLLSEQGLYGTGFRISIQPGDGSGFALAAQDPVLGNSAAFDDLGGPVIDFESPHEIGVLLLADPFADDGDLGVVGDSVGIGVRRVFLGAVRVQAPAAFGAESLIDLRDFRGSTDDTVTWDSLSVLDDQIGSATMVIRTIPAPGAMLLGCSLGLGCLITRRR